MTKGAEFTEIEKGEITGLRTAGWTFAAIGKRLGRSPTSVNKFWRNQNSYGKKKRPGRPKKVCERTERRIVLEAKKEGTTASAVQATLGVNISVRTVQRALQKASFMRYGKRNGTPRLTENHKLARRDWAKRMNRERVDWTTVIFSNEEKFNLDGPDGMQYYWYDLRREKATYFSRQNGGGSVMVWGGFSAKGTTMLAILTGRQDSLDYQETLSTYMLPFGDAVHDGRYTFQHDNASIHTSASTKRFLQDLNVTVLDWPALSPDLNPIENVWGVLARAVYGGSKQYATVVELKNAILRAWRDLDPQLLQKLVISMPDRVCAVLEAQGAKINY